MAFDIYSQNFFQNTQFQQFVDFAESAGKEKAIARLVDTDKVGNMANRTIIPGKGDWVGIGAGRLASLKQANNTTRDAFMTAVGDMFGGVDHIPDSVKDAMKMQDYGKGKPLTARRILAVKTAIESFANAAKADAEKAVERLFDLIPYGVKTAPQEAKDALANKVRDFIGACKNADEREVLTHNIVAITVRGNATIRSNDEIDKRVAEIKANIKELHEVAKGNQEILNAGKALLKAINGRSLKPGLIGILTALGTSKDVKLGEVKRLNASADSYTIARAVIQLQKNVAKAAIKAGADLLDDATSRPIQDFLTRLMIGRFGKGKLCDIRAALLGNGAVELNNLHEEISKSNRGVFALNNIEQGGDIDDEVIREFITGDPNKLIPKRLHDKIRELSEGLTTKVMHSMTLILDELVGGDRPPEAPPSEVLPVDSLPILEEIKDWVYEAGLYNDQMENDEVENEEVKNDEVKNEVEKEVEEVEVEKD